MQLTSKEIKVIQEFFTDKPVIKAYVFGFYSRGESSEESDLDLLVELDYTQPIGLEFFNMKFELEDKLNKNVDLVSSRSLSKYIVPFIEKDKKLIYDFYNSYRHQRMASDPSGVKY